MPGTFAYTESTNTIEVTDGTSGAPATFNDMYTADQAGTDTVLLDAGAPANDLALQYAVRPTHNKALLLDCVVANKTAEADYIFITGTDWKGDAQTESIDVTAGNGTYPTTKYWATVTTLDCSDNAAGGGNVWDDGDLTVTQDIWGVVWEFSADENYQIDCDIQFGDDSTATYFQSENEFVFFSDGYKYTIENQATLERGDLYGNYGIEGSIWSMNLSATYDAVTSGDDNASFLMYDSVDLERCTAARRRDYEGGTVDIRNSKIIGSDAANGRFGIYCGLSTTNVDIDRLQISGCNTGLGLACFPDSLSGYFNHRSRFGVLFASQSIATGMEITSPQFAYLEQNANDRPGRIRDPLNTVTTPQIDAATGAVIVEYTVNVHVTDKEGNNLSGVSMTIKDTSGNSLAVVDSTTDAAEDLDVAETDLNVDDGTQFASGDVIKINNEYMYVDSVSVNTLTLTRAYYSDYDATFHSDNTDIYKVQAVTSDANGDFAEQIIDYRRWEGTSETLTTYSPHEFTFTKAGFEPYIIKGVTVDSPINWEIKMTGASGAWNKQWR